MPEFPASKDFVAHLHTAFKVETPVARELELSEVHDRSNAQLEQFDFHRARISMAAAGNVYAAPSEYGGA